MNWICILYTHTHRSFKLKPEKWSSSTLSVNHKDSSYLLIAKTCKHWKHLASTHYSHQLLREITSVCVNRRQLTSHGQVLAQCCCFMNGIWTTRTPAPGDPAGVDEERRSPGDARSAEWDLNLLLCVHCRGRTETLSTVKPLCTWQREVCLSGVIWWRGVSLDQCWRSFW